MMHTPLDGGTAEAVFAEARFPGVWREPIRNRRIAERAQQFLDRALVEAGTPIPWWGFADYVRFDVNGDRQQFEDLYFDRRRRLFAAAIGALFSDDVPISATEDVMWAICDEYAWALPAHIAQLSSPHPEVPHDESIDLFAAETAFALAEIVALLGRRLHPLVVARVRREVERRVLTPFRERSWPWETSETNWSAVCAASIGIAAMHLEADGLESILDRCTAAMDVFLAGYGNDGICVEGLNYWNYGFGHFAFYAEALRQRTGIDLWHGPHQDRLAAIVRYPRGVSLGGRAVAAFSDAEPYGMVASALAGITETLDPSSAVSRELWSTSGWAHNWGPVIRQFVWARDLADEVADAPASATWFADAQWLVIRASAGANELGFAAKAGHNDEPHNHNDLGSFVLAVNGEPLLSELGMGFYDAAYFQPGTRYDSISAGSQGHSVPTIGGVRQRQGRDAAAIVEEVSAGDGHLVLDLTSAYDHPDLRRARRTLAFADGTLTISDEFALTDAVEIVDRIVSLFPIALAGEAAVIRGDRGAVRLTWSDGWEPRLDEAPFRTHDGDPSTAHFLDLVRTASNTRCTITVSVV
ncbi:heparinase II/III-family protein [Microbacterium sp. M28]|uniref:heparinase II/III-family protein n=1 Tax=Microbacterium sp. M28 TaxID=2962064 RepID=UPI0021F4B2B0|nr:heparinase II/III-family protein [Microbacterium sp. M28]UYO97004.1 heparinase II/III-family protein [Microbacterium sp. M28]